ncbi:NAD-glutamate dehydrogenase domain-containing protein [Rhodococcus jostii]|uniref:NAD-glutamate dehydrogenase n=1 Tax=Rhodococcus jostii TaxID=132919 RepID=A0ABU4CU78_RHOJO|nr:NAD-glutamate dehydrogenase domain-containing protein [Rhodococcus jostii]MDV6286765.1 NAD-glutamate dehydrogenase [Rhodococcus jostii]
MAFTPRDGGADPFEIKLYREPSTRHDGTRVRILSGYIPTLSDLLPLFTAFGLEVIDERAGEIEAPENTNYEIDLGVRSRDATQWSEATSNSHELDEKFIEAIRAVWTGECESDALNALVLTAGLTWRQVTWLRAIAAYLRQTQAAFSLQYICDVLASHPRLSALLIRIFEERFDPDRHGGLVSTTRRHNEDAHTEHFVDGLDNVASLDEDRILRSVLAIIKATVRTNAFQLTDGCTVPSRVSFKIEPSRIPGLPQPAPAAEIWVYSPRVEGVHMRFGKVARGGIRWSDRREDFRTEVLALAKAQVAKNAVIVPTGAKGAYLPKRLPPVANRDEWINEGREAYKQFVAGLLDVTDNRVDTAIVGPPRVVRHDEDDPYLVVAADKGTATFSDYANEVARAYGFWLDDAFASGGSRGYDHKAMGITARGAWVSVERHLLELGIDPSRDQFTAIGIGDMSGDVFGNGMLLSPHLRLVAAFDHRHIFIDPNPPVPEAFAERQRLASLPRSSWADYNRDLLSKGGLVAERTAKSVPLSHQATAALGLTPTITSLTPAELIRAILSSPADLLWNGGIGTYVKAGPESHSEVGDRSNDGVRIDAGQLRVRAIGEGGNLGLTQAARIQAALAGIQVNTDAVDNSAGVDTSDYEVNIKIALSSSITSETRTSDGTDDLLSDMTGDVAAAVLSHNYDQNVLLAMEAHRASENLSLHRRLMRHLTETGYLHRTLDTLPTESELAQRESTGLGLARPELAVLMASAKNYLKNALAETDVCCDPAFAVTLRGYFPARLGEVMPTAIMDHPLGPDIVVNQIANDVINFAGITAVYRAVEETEARVDLVVKAYIAAIDVFGHREFRQRLKSAESTLPPLLTASIRHEGQRLLDRAARWFLNRYPSGFSLETVVSRTKTRIAALWPDEPARLVGEERARFDRNVLAFEAMGSTPDLAKTAAAYLDGYVLLDIMQIADDLQLPDDHTAVLYHYISEQFRIDYLLTRVSLLPRPDQWDRLARAALREDLYGVLSELTRNVQFARSTDALSNHTLQELFEEWEASTNHLSVRARRSVAQVCVESRPSLSAISVAVRSLRALTNAGKRQHHE